MPSTYIIWFRVTGPTGLWFTARTSPVHDSQESAQELWDYLHGLGVDLMSDRP